MTTEEWWLLSGHALCILKLFLLVSSLGVISVTFLAVVIAYTVLISSQHTAQTKCPQLFRHSCDSPLKWLPLVQYLLLISSSQEPIKSKESTWGPRLMLWRCTMEGVSGEHIGFSGIKLLPQAVHVTLWCTLFCLSISAIRFCFIALSTAGLGTQGAWCGSKHVCGSVQGEDSCQRGHCF